MRPHRLLLALIMFGLQGGFSALYPQTSPLLPNGMAQTYHVVREVLPNGLTVFINEDPNAARVLGAIAFKAGGKTDYPEATGMAHYLEHMLFKGTQQLGTWNWPAESVWQHRIDSLYDVLGKTTDAHQRLGVQLEINQASQQAARYAIPNEFDRLISSIGGEDANAFTDYDITVYHNTFPAWELERWLDLYAERLDKPVFRLFQSELEVVYEEKNRWNDNYLTVAFDKLMQTAFRNHPYGKQTVLGTTEHLKNPSLSRMYKYFNTYYVANNATLVLTGNLKAEEALPLIRRKFGNMRSGPVPAFPKYAENPFRGREQVTGHYTPIRAGALAWRLPGEGHPDLLPLRVLEKMLSNDANAGLLDELRLNDRLMLAQTQFYVLQDHGLAAMIFVPKIVGQRMRKAEDLLLEAVDQLRRGQFSDTLLASARNALYRLRVSELEDPERRAFNLGFNCFIVGRSWEDYLADLERIRHIDREEIVRVANEYLGKNYLAFYSRMGKPKAEKLKKPPFEPVLPDSGQVSAYARHFDSLPQGQPRPQFVDFSQDVDTVCYATGRMLTQGKNPENDLFSLEVRYGLGRLQAPMLNLLDEYLGNLGLADGTPALTLKQRFFALGCDYGFDFGRDYFSISLTGIEHNRAQALELLASLLKDPVADRKAHRRSIREIRTERRLQAREPSDMATALFHYVALGQQAEAASRPSVWQMRRFRPDSLQALLGRVLAQPSEALYVGAASLADVQADLVRYLGASPSVRPVLAPTPYSLQEYDTSRVFFYHTPGARQAQVMAYLPGAQPFVLADAPKAAAFNLYLLNEVLFPEIREYRSLAYGVGGRFMPPTSFGTRGFVMLNVGTQADKSPEVMRQLSGILHRLPRHPDHWQARQQTLVNATASSRPGFRALPAYVASARRLGYTTDPARLRYEAFGQMPFDSVLSFWQAQRGTQPPCFIVLADTRRLKAKQLRPYGQLVEVRRRKFFVR